jgi:Spy/CpxP family protein refolding chaperone
VDDIALLRAEIAKIRIRQVLALHKVLTPEQRATLREKMKARMERHAPGERKRKRSGDKPELQGKPQTPPVPQEK